MCIINMSKPTELVWPSILSAVVLTTSFLRVHAPVAVITINITRFIWVWTARYVWQRFSGTKITSYI